MFQFLKALCVLTVAILALSAQARSPVKSKIPEFPEILTYNQLMSLAPYKRAAYMRGLRGMLVELSVMSSRGHGSFVSDNSGIEVLMHPNSAEREESYNALLLIFDALIPAVHADVNYDYKFSTGLQGRECSRSNFSPRTETIVGLGNEGKMYCFPQQKYSDWKRANANRLWSLDKEVKSAENAYRSGQAHSGQAVKDLAAMKSQEQALDAFHAEEERKAMVSHQKFVKNQKDTEDERNAMVSAQAFTKQQDDGEAERASMVAHQKFTAEQDSAEIEREGAIGHQAFAKQQNDGEAERSAAIGYQNFVNDTADADAERAAAIAHSRFTAEQEAREEANALKGHQKFTESQDSGEAERKAFADASKFSKDQDSAEAERNGAVAASDLYGEREASAQLAKNNLPGNHTLAGSPVAAPAATAVAPKAEMAPASVSDPLPSKEQNEVCHKTLLTCEDKSLKKYRSEKGKILETFRSKKEDSCISSGNMSGYKDGEIKPNNCKSVNTFCFNPEDEKCTEAGKYKPGDSRRAREKANPGEPSGIGHATSFTCEKGSLCNPLVFGAYVKSGKGLCVPGGSANLTVNCDREVKSIQAKGGKDFTLDVLKDGGPGVANAWDDWRDKFNKTCKGGSESQLAHCEECTVIASRLRQMNRLATGSCDYGLNYDQVSKQKPSPGNSEAGR